MAATQYMVPIMKLRERLRLLDHHLFPEERIRAGNWP